MSQYLNTDPTLKQQEFLRCLENNQQPQLLALSLEPVALPCTKPRLHLDERVRVAVVVATSVERKDAHAALLRAFRRQTWPNKRLVVVESGAAARSPLWSAAPADEVTYVPFLERLRTGDALNRARALAADADVFAVWSDADAYAPGYCERLVSALLLDKDEDGLVEMSKEKDGKVK